MRHTPSLGRAGARAVGLLALVLFSACALFSTGASGLETNACNFQGAQTACGLCVAASCQALVNACCNDGACSGSLGYLDGCASGDSSSCTLLRNGSYLGAGTSFTALGACVAASCAACGGGDVIVTPGFDASMPTPKPGITCSSVNGSCFCDFQTDPSPSTTACIPSMFMNGICCADQNYPKAGSCTCSPFTCTVDSSGCECSSLYDPASSQPVSVCAGMGCCASNGLCSCGPSNTCDPSFQTQVHECLPDNTGCAGNQVRVTACSQ